MMMIAFLELPPDTSYSFVEVFQLKYISMVSTSTISSTQQNGKENIHKNTRRLSKKYTKKKKGEKIKSVIYLTHQDKHI